MISTGNEFTFDFNVSFSGWLKVSLRMDKSVMMWRWAMSTACGTAGVSLWPRHRLVQLQKARLSVLSVGEISDIRRDIRMVCQMFAVNGAIATTSDPTGSTIYRNVLNVCVPIQYRNREKYVFCFIVYTFKLYESIRSICMGLDLHIRILHVGFWATSIFTSLSQLSQTAKFRLYRTPFVKLWQMRPGHAQEKKGSQGSRHGNRINSIQKTCENMWVYWYCYKYCWHCQYLWITFGILEA